MPLASAKTPPPMWAKEIERNAAVDSTKYAGRFAFSAIRRSRSSWGDYFASAGERTAIMMCSTVSMTTNGTRSRANIT